ncbi:tannase/feruloyl esterase family alpha/beta hydrolase [Microbacterium sp. JZ31]|uniref:tannase/feruloyl esterase family alpha/beta hydrolase n=1 Tax=Microbacterium sp. JZ31 TaxID=1906274 RepID=UPI0019333F0F|nr:tannase/feruloyl esterase family alpha/beta hydrolase [Microbacterium sp. JZ31]
MKRRNRASIALAAAAALLLATPLAAVAHGGHGGHGDPDRARPGTLRECETLTGFGFEQTTVTLVRRVPAGEVTHAGVPVGEHCLVQGRMNERTSPVDGQDYAIGFEMRLPVKWAGRFLHQGNGGMDGSVSPAVGSFTGGQLRNGLQQGFAILSSDAGHSGAQNPLFGLDPQARLDYGYQAVGTLTPMAKALVTAAYGRAADTSYFAGGSNGGRHTMVAAARYADEYDGFLAIAPGFNLPQAAVAQVWGAQQWNTVATTPGDLKTAFTAAERRTVANAILARCDGLDRLTDGMVQDSAACQRAFDVKRHVPTCADERDGTCLTPAQKRVIQTVFAGAKTSSGKRIYASFPFDAGIANSDWATWELTLSALLDPMAVGFVFSSTPESPGILANIGQYALSMDIDAKAKDIYRSGGIYTESAMQFMTPPEPTELDELRDSGGRLIVAHGASDAVFSADDTARWFEQLDRENRNKAERFARYFEVPGMGHVSGGVATDQFDGLGAIVAWVEQGKAPDRLIASARGAGNPGGVNPEVPASWSPDRTRPLCVYPLVARYVGGDPESAASFACKPSSGGGHGGR